MIEGPRHVPYSAVKDNIARWLRKGFGDVGQFRLGHSIRGGCSTWDVEVYIEGAPVHDAAYVLSVERQFQKHFVDKGWGNLAWGRVREAKLMAGDAQDGKPRKQLIVMPKPLLSLQDALRKARE